MTARLDVIARNAQVTRVKGFIEKMSRPRPRKRPPSTSVGA